MSTRKYKYILIEPGNEEIERESRERHKRCWNTVEWRSADGRSLKKKKLKFMYLSTLHRIVSLHEVGCIKSIWRPSCIDQKDVGLLKTLTLVWKGPRYVVSKCAGFSKPWNSGRVGTYTHVYCLWR